MGSQFKKIERGKTITTLKIFEFDKNKDTPKKGEIEGKTKKPKLKLRTNFET